MAEEPIPEHSEENIAATGARSMQGLAFALVLNDLAFLVWALNRVARHEG